MTRDAPRIIIHNRDTRAMAERLGDACPEAEIAECNSHEDMHALVPAFRPDIVYTVRFDGDYPRTAVLGADGPGWISVGGSGCDHLNPWDPDKVTVTNSAGVAAGMMAEYVFGCALYFTLDIPGLNRDKVAREWRHSRTVTPLAGKTILIVGLGQTGQAVAARAKAFGMKVIGTRARPEPMEHVDAIHGAEDLPELWRTADLIAVCVPLLPSTRRLIDARAFAAMKPEAILVDVSRGGVIDGGALINALRGGAIAAAALDVSETEPLPGDSPIWELENVIVSPHCSSVYEGWSMQSFEMFIDNLGWWQKGAALMNIVDPRRGY